MEKLFSSSRAFISQNKIDAYQSGELSGLNFAIKDNIDIANTNTTNGSPAWADAHTQPVAHAVCVEQLLASGATCLGKTYSDELAYSLLGVNPFYGTPLNPKAPDRVPGGSSSGSAAAVARGLVDFALGTDTGGSVRVPASNCGIWGYRPSHGTISIAGVAALAPSFDTVGVLASSGKILESVISVLLAAEKVEHNHSLSVVLLDDVFAKCDSKIMEVIKAITHKISKHNRVEHQNLASITEAHVNCDWLFKQR